MLTISLFDECLYAAELGLFENNEVDALWCAKVNTFFKFDFWKNISRFRDTVKYI